MRHLKEMPPLEFLQSRCHLAKRSDFGRVPSGATSRITGYWTDPPFSRIKVMMLGVGHFALVAALVAIVLAPLPTSG
ncbi:MAG: hypothetical protein ACE5G5_13050, partial [Candidatus Methylomirabilales bacterium]